MSQRLFHVEMFVKETKLWDLLDVIEKTAGVGDLKVRHVTEAPKLLDSVDTTQLALPDVQPPKLLTRGINTTRVLQAMQPDVPTAPKSLTRQTGLTAKQISMALYNLLQHGFVKRLEIGMYMRVAS